jgi:hypothetical protein
MPLISWSQSAIQNVTYSGGVVQLEFMTDLATLIGTLTHWSIETTDLDATGGAYVLKPDPGSAYPNQRILLFASSTAIGDRANSYMDTYDSASATESKTVGIGYCRDITGGTYVDWNSTNPFGFAAAQLPQWWLYQIASPQFTASLRPNHMYAVESADGLALFFNKTATASWWGMVAGYLMEDIDGVPFSMCMTSGPSVISSTFWGSSNAFADGSGVNDTNASMQAWKGAVSARDSVTKLSLKTTAAPQLTTAGGTRVHLPRYYRFLTVPLNFAGNLRQIRMGEDVLTRTQLSNGGGAVQSTLFSASLGSVADSLAFDEG